MTFRADPPIDRWPELANGKAVVTGHQPWLWHPGILAKVLAADAAMPPGLPLRYVVVDQDVQDALRLALPVQEGDNLRVHRLRLGAGRVDVPTGCQPAVEVSLGDMPAGVTMDVSAIRAALAAAPLPTGEGGSRSETGEGERSATSGQAAAGSGAQGARPLPSPLPGGEGVRHQTLAQQITGVLHALLQPYLSRPIEAFYATEFEQQPWFADELQRILGGAAELARTYNAAVAEHPEAGMTRLTLEPDRIEVPLWALQWMGPRRRVYVDIADSTPIFVDESGEPIDPSDDAVTLAPRALLMTAWIRRDADTGLFVHGTGGGVYDRITDRWWSDWRGETLAPMAVATADLYLDFDAPVSDRDELTRAVWHAHHLPHNIDRELRLDDTPAREKRELLARMDDDRDKARRRAAFEVIHRINDDLAAAHPDAVAAARHRLDRAHAGLANRAIAAKRDWCFALYPERKLQALRHAISEALPSSRCL